MRTRTGLVLAGAALLMGAATHSGGWAVLTVHELPTHLVASQPQTITFTVRQHGAELMRGPEAWVTVRTAGRMSRPQRVDAIPTRNPGEYSATIAPETPGRVTLQLHGNPRMEDVALRPLAVVAAGAPAPAIDAYERGRDLFVAKGCVTCHVKSDDPEMLERRSVAVGPALGGRRFDAAWLTTKISDPAVNRVRYSDYVVMPRLEMTADEVGALVSYLNHRVVASK